MKIIKKYFFQNWYRSLLTVITILLGLYALAGFVIVPWLARPRIIEAIHDLTSRETRLDKMKLNPFALSATIEGFEITDLNGEPLISFTRAHANVQLLPLVFKDEFHIKKLNLMDPFFRAEVGIDGNLNFADIIEKFSGIKSPKEESTTSTSKHLKVDQLIVGNGSVSISDLSRSAPFHTTIYPINFEINEFHTSGESDAPYGFSATTESGESVKWEGYVTLAPVRSAGAFEVTDFSLPKYDPFADIFLRTDIIDGTIGVAGNYNYQSGSDSKAILENAEITIQNLKVVEEADQSPILSLGQGTITGIILDAIKSELTIESATMQESQVHLTRMEDGQIDVLNLIKVEQIQKPERQDAHVDQDATSVEFKYLLKSLSINNSSVEILDETTTTPTLLAVDQIEMGLEDFRSEPGSEAGISLSTNIRSGGSVKIVGNFSLQPIRATLDLELSDLALSAGNGYLSQFVDLQLEEGEVNTTGRAILDLSKDNPAGEFSGNVRFIGLKAIDMAEGDELATLSLFNIEEIKATMDPMSVSIGSISIVDPRAEIIINQDGSTNLMRVLRVPTEQPEESSAPEDDQEEEVVISDETESTASALPFPVTIGSITLENAGAAVTDNSIDPSVQLGLETLSGTVEGLSSEELARADLQFSGKLVGGTLLSIKGKINPLISDKYSDMEVSFKGFNLTAVSPYSGKFAGYALNKGKLSFDMNYKISHAELTGENVMHIDQLTLGDKVESDDALNLPIPMAIALLKDQNGMIEIDVPVSGNLNDPEFSFGRVIGRAILNVVTNIITSPFSLLGNIVSGGEDVDLSHVAFSPGFRELETDSMEKLDLMAEALKERPNLRLDIIGSAGSPDEISAISHGKLETNLKTIRWQELKDSGSPVTTVEVTAIPVADRNRLIQQLFLSLFPEEAPSDKTESEPMQVPPTPEEIVAVESSNKKDGVLKTIWKKLTRSSPKSETAADAPEDTQSVAEIPFGETEQAEAMEPVVKFTVMEMEERILTTIVVEENDLLELASERAEAVRNYLEVTGEISAGRLFINQPEDATTINPETGNPEVIFKLE